jgi:MoxR-like ATPase
LKNTDAIEEIESDFANLARLAAAASVEDVRLYLAKLVRKYRTQRPELATRLDQSLKSTQTRSSGPSIMRKGLPEIDLPDLLPQDADSRQSLVRVFDDRDGLTVPILPTDLISQIDGIVLERQQRARLAEHGIRPTRSAILVGPPGVGKTLSARYIAASINKPLWVLDLTTVMSSLLGKTGNNLRLVFDHAKKSEAVLLLDEVDSIAKRRSDESDVGELKRLVTAILQEVDNWPDSGLLLAATNHPELIDPALWRRFDAILRFDVSDQPATEAAIRRFLGADTQFDPWISLLTHSLQGQALSNVERAILNLRRNALLHEVAPSKLVIDLAVRNSEGMDKAARRELAISLARDGKMSHNQISELTGVARDTLRKYAGPSPIKGRGLKKE